MVSTVSIVILIKYNVSSATGSCGCCGFKVGVIARILLTRCDKQLFAEHQESEGYDGLNAYKKHPGTQPYEVTGSCAQRRIESPSPCAAASERASFRILLHILVTSPITHPIVISC